VSNQPATKHLVGIGDPIEYLGVHWTVQTITKRHVILVAVGNPSRTTRVELSVFEKVV
jgi:hypothetical protein